MQRNLFEAIKAACLAANGQEAEEMEDEPTVSPGEVVESDQVPSTIMSVSYNSAFLVGCVAVVLYLLWSWLSRPREESMSDTAVTRPSDEILNIGRRMDDLEVEIKAIQYTLNEVLVLLKAQHEARGID